MTKKPPPRGKRGIPTMFDGVMYRSRLEAKWAAFFKRLGWHFDYEPYDLENYIPDFLVHFEGGDLLVEVKPDTTLDDLKKHAKKIVRSGWSGEFLIVGSTLHRSSWGSKFGPILGLLAERHGREALLGAAQVFFCTNCWTTSVLHADASWRCRACGADRGNAHVGDVSPGVVEGIWAAVGNHMQWKPEGWPT